MKNDDKSELGREPAADAASQGDPELRAEAAEQAGTDRRAASERRASRPADRGCFVAARMVGDRAGRSGAAVDRAGVVACVHAPVRQPDAGLLRDAAQAVDPRRRRDQACRLHRARLLQPLVALRLDARHVADRLGRRARERRPTRQAGRSPARSRSTLMPKSIGRNGSREARR